MAYITSYGAAETVTGSCHILKLDSGLSVMVDCGMFQGAVEKKNYRPFGFNPKKIDILFITHAHLDHIGRIPLLVKKGFRGKIYATKPTIELAEIVLLDSAKVMEEDYKTRLKKALRAGREDRIKKPLYGIEDVKRVFKMPIVYVEYDRMVNISKGVKAIFKNAGHILGASIIDIRFKEKSRVKRVVFSGDLGGSDDIVMKEPKKITRADALFIESTYGDRDHKSLKDSEAEFKQVVIKTLLEKGSVVIPSFAIERTQEILCILKKMYYQGELPKCKVFLDSPMGIKATQIYNFYNEDLSKCCRDFFKKDGSVFNFPYLNFTQSIDESKMINYEDSCVIIAGSGMCTGGRILHHLKHHVWNHKNALIFVGYQAEGSLGRKIVDGAKRVKIYKEDIAVNAKVYTINGFSAHAGQKELIEWIESIKRLGKIFLVHGELEKQKIFKKEIKRVLGKRAHIVAYKERISI